MLGIIKLCTSKEIVEFEGRFCLLSLIVLPASERSADTRIINLIDSQTPVLRMSNHSTVVFSGRMRWGRNGTFQLWPLHSAHPICTRVVDRVSGTTCSSCAPCLLPLVSADDAIRHHLELPELQRH